MTASIQKFCNNTVSYSKKLLNLDSSTARIEVQCLLQAVLQVNRAYLMTHPEQSLSASSTQHIRHYSNVVSVVSQSPMCLVSANSFGLNFKISPAALIPRPETELLVEWHYSVLRNGRMSNIGFGHRRGSICAEYCTCPSEC